MMMFPTQQFERFMAWVKEEHDKKVAREEEAAKRDAQFQKSLIDALDKQNQALRELKEIRLALSGISQQMSHR